MRRFLAAMMFFGGAALCQAQLDTRYGGNTSGGGASNFSATTPPAPRYNSATPPAPLQNQNSAPFRNITQQPPAATPPASSSRAAAAFDARQPASTTFGGGAPGTLPTRPATSQPMQQFPQSSNQPTYRPGTQPPATFGSQNFTAQPPVGSIQPTQLPASGYPSRPMGATASGDMSPQSMINTMLTPPQNADFGGNSTSLAEVVSFGRTRAEQGAIVDAYWDLCASLADYYLSLREAGELDALRRKVPAMSAALQQAGGELRNRIDTARTAALANQYRLGSYMGGAGRPLPSDLPFCGEYNPRYQEIFSGRASSEADQLVRLLPSRYAEMNAAANSVLRSQEWLGKVEQDPQVSTDGIVRSLELLALNRRAFVQLVKDYNRRINRYTQLSRPDKIEPNRLVAMLVERPQGVSTAARTGASSLNWQSASQDFSDPMSRYGAPSVR